MIALSNATLLRPVLRCAIVCLAMLLSIAVQPVAAQEPGPNATVPVQAEPGTDASSEAAAASETTGEPDTGLDLEGTATDILDSLGSVFEQTPKWAWLALFLAILGGLIAGKITQAVLRNAGSKLRKKGRKAPGITLEDAASPASLALLTFGITLGMVSIVMPPDLAAFSQNVIKLLYIIAIGWFLFNLVDLIDLVLTHQVEKTESKLAMQIAPLIRKALRIFIIIIFTLLIAQNVFGVNVTAWLAGLGIAGLAISLAAQDSIKNLFGSVTVLLDKPFAVGDRIQFNGADGFVEEIGFRSTRIRTFTGHLVTVPNMRFIDGTIENVSARAFIRRMLDVTITYDTPPEKIREAVQVIKDLLASADLAEPFRMDDRPPRVYFNEFNSDSLNISVAYWYFLDADAGRDWWGYLEHGEKFNHKLFEAFAEAGIDFAFPTQTLYLAGDPDRQLSVRLLGDPAAQAERS
ncbi:MAG: mechanosensitive ion channel family protein [Phycisphaerales bacterium]